jgi:DNA mismatch repair ATPase MutS
VDEKAEAPEPKTHPVIEELNQINPDEMTPLQALAVLHAMKHRLDKEEHL